MTDMCKSRLRWICRARKQTCKTLSFVGVCFFPPYLCSFSLPLHFFLLHLVVILKTQANKNHFTMVVFSHHLMGISKCLDVSSSKIHALTILHAWAHPIGNLFINMGAQTPFLGRLERKKEPTLSFRDELDCSCTQWLGYWSGLP